MSSIKDTLKAIINASFLSQPPTQAYYSEASMQLKLGIELWKRLGVEPKMELRHSTSKEYLDIFLNYSGVRYGIELKYKTRLCPGFRYARQGAQDHGRYDFIHDVSRIENFISSDFIDKGISCIITNDHLYWSSLKDTSFAKAFQLTDGTILTGTYTPRWKNRTKPVTLQRRYLVEWFAASGVVPENAPFKALLIADETSV